MSLLQKKNSINTIMYSKITLGILVLLCGFLAMSVYERFVVERHMQGRRVEAEAELNRLETRKDELVEKVQYLEGERGIEEEIRKHFDVVKEGERVVIILDDEDTAPTALPQSEAEAHSFWSDLFSW